MSYKSSIYKWNRISQPRVYSRAQRVTSDDDIQNWLKTVEDASNKAAAETFGTKYIAPRKQCKDNLKYAVENAQIHDAAYAEAQDLLNQWVTDKIHLDNEMDEYSEEKWDKRTQTDIKKEWDHLLSKEVDLEIEDLYSEQSSNGSKGVIVKKKSNERDPYSILYKDDGDLVNEVLDEMWQKELVDDNFRNDLELDSQKHHDPTTKMKLRHLQVKENREKRLKDKERKLKELQLKKDSQFKARQILMKEEKTKTLQRKKEELEIQKEMAYIRKEMEEEKRQQLEELTRQKELEELSQKEAEELEQKKREGWKLKQKTKHQAEERKRNLMNKMHQIETKIATENLKILQKYFSAWYNVVIERRLATGKAKAMADWKLLLRSFNAWKAYSRSKQMDRQAWTHEENLREIQRKNNMADIYYRNRLLSKCFVAWELFVSQQQTHRFSEESNKKTKDKMAAFLEAAASGKLWSERGQTPTTDSARSQNTHGKNKQQVDALFNQPAKVKGSFSLHSTSRSETDVCRTKKVNTPIQPWQITRKHLKLSKKEIQSMASKQASKNLCTCTKNNGDNVNSDIPQCSFCISAGKSENETDTITGNKSPNKPWAKTPFVVNNFEHRHAAQQKILEMQQKQIKEQQRLIEELQYLQKQQLLQQQLLQQEQAKKLIDNNGADSTETIQTTLSHLQQHIQRLQQRLIEGGDSSNNGGNVMDIELTDLEDASDVGSIAPSSALKLDLSSVAEDSESKSVPTNKGSMTAKSAVSTTSVVSKGCSATPSAATSRTASTASHPRHQQFLKTMEERAAERSRFKKEREEKKQKEEGTKLAQLLAEEEKRKLEEELLKKQRIEAHREKKRLDKLREVEKQEFAKKMKEWNVIADQHREMSLIKYHGLRPWRKLIQILRNKEKNAEHHYEMSLKKKYFCGWHKTVKQDLEVKYQMAEQFNIYITTKHVFTKWKQVKHASVIQEQKADRHYEYKLKSYVLKEWADFAAEEKVSMWHKERKAKEHNLVRIKKKHFGILRRFPQTRKEEEERERRKAEMRKRVAYLLPDYRTSQKDD